MELQNANPTVRETAIVPEFDPLAFVEASEVSGEASVRETVVVTNPETVLFFEDATSVADPLSAFEAPETQTPATRKSSGFRDSIGFLVRYVAVSSAVFVVLLVTANYSAYSTIAWNWMSPDAVKASSAAVVESIVKSKITAYASESESGAEIANVEQAEDLKKKLDESNVVVKENILSPKKLVPAKPQMNVDFDILPYENRIVIPKIGKNIPLVDVESGNGVDFDHMENIFMKELEKGVIRYPGTARPGESGNAFVFGHSSNYPWMKGAYNQVFALLDQLVYGDEIIVYYDQKKYVYVIGEKKIVKPGDVKVLNRGEGRKELSLMTCWPVGTTLKRMIVFAELKETAPLTQ
ncbi:MAG: sortase [Patescibacteria group bacterium]|nr:sortase [Patescibacteria group bacterium]